jgi:hypothetical protein
VGFAFGHFSAHLKFLRLEVGEMGGAMAMGAVMEGDSRSSDEGSHPPFQCSDRKLIQFLKVIFRSEFARDAFIHFIRHEQITDDGKDQNYFKHANFALIGSNEEKLSEVLSPGRESPREGQDHRIVYHSTPHDEYTYPSLIPFFERMDLATKRIIFGHQMNLHSPGHGHNFATTTTTTMLTQFQKCPDEIVLLMAIEALPRFETSQSFQQWFQRENGTEFSISNLFSYHEKSSRTVILHSVTGKEINGFWSGKGENIFPAIIHCLNQFPIASALLHADDTHHYHMIYVSEFYAKIFSTLVSEMISHPFNLLSSMTHTHITEALKEHHLSKGEIKYHPSHISPDSSPNVEQHSNTTITTQSLALGVKRILDQCSRCIAHLVVVVDMTADSFSLEALKLSMDLLDIFPSTLRIKYPFHLSPFSESISSSVSEIWVDHSRSSAY